MTKERSPLAEASTDSLWEELRRRIPYPRLLEAVRVAGSRSLEYGLEILAELDAVESRPHSPMYVERAEGRYLRRIGGDHAVICVPHPSAA